MSLQPRTCKTMIILWALFHFAHPAKAQTTVAAPTNLAAVAAVDATAKPQITLAWRDNSNNESNFVIYRGTTGNVSPIATLDANTISYTDRAVTAGITYQYVIRAGYKPSIT